MKGHKGPDFMFTNGHIKSGFVGMTFVLAKSW